MKTYLNFAHELADTARDITLSYFRQSIEIDFKSDESPVTIADKACEAKLRECIEAEYPEHGIIGEEQADKLGTSSFQWIIDPIDGTKNFISGMPMYGTLIALLFVGQPSISIIDIPALNERWSAARDGHAIYNGQTTTTRRTDQLEHAIAGWTSPDIFTANELSVTEKAKTHTKHVVLNGDCYLYGRLASGDIDVVLESTLKPFDYMALVLVVEQAGGIISDWQGNPLTLNSTEATGGQVLACANKALHTQVLDLIQS